MRAATRISTTLCSATTPRHVIVPLCHAVQRRHQSTSTENHTSSRADSIAHNAAIPNVSSTSAPDAGNSSRGRGTNAKKSRNKGSGNRKKLPIFRPWSTPMGSNTAWLKKYIEESGVEPTLDHYRLFQKKSNIYRMPLTRKEFDDIITDVDLTGVPNWTTSALQKKRKDYERMKDAGIIEKKPYIFRITGAEEDIDDMDKSMDSALTLEKRYTNEDIDYEALFEALIEMDPTYVARVFRNSRLTKLRLHYIHNMVKLGLQEGTLGANRDGSIFIGQEAFRARLLAAGVDQHFLIFYKVDTTTREIDFDNERAYETLVQYDEKGLDSIPGSLSLNIGTMVSDPPARSPLESPMKSERLLQNSDIARERTKLTQKLLGILDPTALPVDSRTQATSKSDHENTLVREIEDSVGLSKHEREISSDRESLSSAILKNAQELSSLIGSLEDPDATISDNKASISPSTTTDETLATGTLTIERIESSDFSPDSPAVLDTPILDASNELHTLPSLAEDPAVIADETEARSDSYNADELPIRKEQASEESDTTTENSQLASAELAPRELATAAIIGQEQSVDTVTEVKSQVAPPPEPHTEAKAKATTPQPPPLIDDGFEYLRQTMMASQQQAKEKEKKNDKKKPSEDDDGEFDFDEEDYDEYPPTPPRRPF
ncbi:hypothetical protein ABW21_db0207602 [Orbilia brochopaga]|nr:hypothetical protein ABW21_db0207602 [Drechslerella brochopaga]